MSCPVSIPTSVASLGKRIVENGPPTIAEAIRSLAVNQLAASSEVEAQAIILLSTRGKETRLPYSEIGQRALRAAAGLRALGVEKGDRLLILLSTSEEYITTICGAILLGAVPCTIAGPTLFSRLEDVSERVQAVYDRLTPALIIVPKNIIDALADHSSIRAEQIVPAEAFVEHPPLAIETLPDLQSSDPLHIQLTSGSISQPKGVMLTHANVVSNMRGIARAIDYDPTTDSGLVWLPLYHDMGFVQLLLAIYARGTIYLMSPASFLRNPLSWLLTMSKYRVAYSAAPTFAYSLCTRKHDASKLAGIDLSAWQRAFVGAEPISINILEEFWETFQPYGFSKETLYPCYGMAETVLATTLAAEMERSQNRRFGFVSCDVIDATRLHTEAKAVPVKQGSEAAPPSLLSVVGVGRAVHGLEVRVCDSDNNFLPDRQVGEICVRGTSLTEGYYNDAERTNAAFHNDWYHTGDRGYLVDGELYILGRIKELLIVRGRNYEAHHVEQVIERHRAVRDDSAVVFSLYNPARGTEDVVVIVETRVSEHKRVQVVQDIQESLRRAFGFQAHDLVFVRPGTLPRTTSRKKQRLLTKELYQDGQFHTSSE